VFDRFSTWARVCYLGDYVMEEAKGRLLEESFGKTWPPHYRSISLQYLLRGFPVLQSRLSLIHFSHTDLPSNSSLTTVKTHWQKPVALIVLRIIHFSLSYCTPSIPRAGNFEIWCPIWCPTKSSSNSLTLSMLIGSNNRHGRPISGCEIRPKVSSVHTKLSSFPPQAILSALVPVVAKTSIARRGNFESNYTFKNSLEFSHSFHSS